MAYKPSAQTLARAALARSKMRGAKKTEPAGEKETGGKSAAAAKRIKVEPRKTVALTPGSIRAINQARQNAYKGRAPIGATGSGGSNVMAGSNMSTAKGIVAGIKAGYNPRVSLNPYEGMTAKEKRAMKKEEVEQVEEALDLKTLRAYAAKSAPEKTQVKKPVPEKKPISRTQDGRLDLNALRDMVKEEGFDPEPADIAAELVKKHGKGNVTSKHLDAYEADRDTRRGLDREEIMKHINKLSEETVNEVSKAEAEKVLGGPTRKMPKGPAGKLPLGFRLARNAARRAMKAGMKSEVKEEVEQVDEAKLLAVATFVPLKKHIENKSLRNPNAIHIPVDPSHGDKSHREKFAKKIGPEKAAMYKLHGVFPRVNEEVEIVEEIKDQADVGEYDYEGDMAKSQLRSILVNAKRMHDMLQDNTNLPEWVQSKITLAQDYILTAASYMEGEMNEEFTDEELAALSEASMTDAQMKKREKFVKSMKPVSDWEKRYPGRGEQVMYATATKMAMKEEAEEVAEETEEPLEEKYMGFKALKAAVAAKGARNPAAVAAAIGRKKYGKEKFQAMAAAGKKANEEVEQVEEANMRFDYEAAARPKSSDVKNFLNRDKNPRAAAASKKYIRRMTKLGGLGPNQTKKDTEAHMKAHFEEVVTEAEGKVAVTPQEKTLAAKHGDPKKITYGDVIKARIQSAKDKALKGKE